MKKCLAWILVLLLMPSFAFAAEEALYEYMDGNTYHGVGPIPNADEIWYVCETDSYCLPLSFYYAAGKEITVIKTELYQIKINSDHHWFLHVQLDATQLNKREISRFCKKGMSDLYAKLYASDRLDRPSTSTFAIANRKDTKEIDIVFYDFTSVTFTSSNPQGVVDISIPHKKSLDITLNTKNFTIDGTRFIIYLSPKNLTSFDSMDSQVYDLLKETLAKKGLSI